MKGAARSTRPRPARDARGARRLASAAVLGLLAAGALPGAARAQTSSPSAPAPTSVAPAADAPADTGGALKEQARSHFDLGLSHFDREEWDAALVEFLRSRELVPTKGNTKNAAICLRKVGRFDESLSMFEGLLRDFPDLSPPDRALAEREIGQLATSVGTLEIRDAPAGATVTIDATERGKTPLPAPVRLSVGSHTVRLVLEGALPFEARVDLAGRQQAVVRAHMMALTQAGRLRVSASGGRRLELVVDGAVVGSTPWEGAVSPGAHTLASRGEGALGTPPQQVDVKANQVAAVELVAAELRARLRVTASPVAAHIAIDDVPVGQGSWEGALPSGRHAVAVSLEGYARADRQVALTDDARLDVEMALRPSALGRSGLVFELDAGAPLGVAWGGDLYGACSGACSGALPGGVQGVLHATYEVPSGLGVGIQAGYLLLRGALDGRAETFTNVGEPARHGSASDELWLSALRLGADAQYVTRRTVWPLTVRLAVGALVGSLKDDRSAAGFVDAAGQPFTVRAGQKPAADFLYVAPEARLGRRLGPHFELNAGLELLVLTALRTPAWNAGAPQLLAGDGGGTFPTANLTAGLMVVAVPGIGLKYEP